jgi:hypothetical protein
VSAHLSFINAGAELIETNSFGANRRKLAQIYLADEVERINSAAVKLARDAREISGREVFIGGSIGPAAPADVAEQARILEGRGADLFMLETFFDLDELVVAVEAVRGVSSLPIVALLTFDAALWSFRAAGVHYVLRYAAFKSRNDWVEVLREDKRGDWPKDPQELTITRRIRDEAILRRVASPSFMPRWADRYWVE